MQKASRPPRISTSTNELLGRIPMFPKLIAVLIATIAISQFPQTRGFTVPFFILAVAIVFVIEGVRVVPQQNAWVVERLGKFHAMLQPGPEHHRALRRPRRLPAFAQGGAAGRARAGLHHRDNTQLSVDGILYFQVTDPRRASYGSTNYIVAITQLAQTTLRSEIGKMELDKTFEERDNINRQVVAALDEAGR